MVMLLGARDRPSDPSTEGSSWRWTTTSRSPMGVEQRDKSPTTSGTAPPKVETSSSGPAATAVKLLMAAAVLWWLS